MLGKQGSYIVIFHRNSSSLEDLESIDQESDRLLSDLALSQALWRIELGIKGRVPGFVVVLTGHCSDFDEDSLAQRRADALRDHFASKGVSADYIRNRAHTSWRRCEDAGPESFFIVGLKSPCSVRPIATKSPGRVSL